MKITLLRTSAAVAVALSFGLTTLVDAQQPARPGPAPAEQPTGAPQDVRAIVVTPEGRDRQSATVARQQVTLRDGATVSVLRPVVAAGEGVSGQEADVQRETPRTWQVAAGQRLWLVDPATGDLRTCAVRQTSTVGVQEIRCLSVSGAAF